MPSTTVQQARRALGRALDDIAAYTVGSAAAQTVTSGDIADLTANASVHKYDGAFVYACTTALQRRVQNGGYVPGSGQLTLEWPWTVPAIGSAFEVSRLLPAGPGIGPEGSSYLECIRRALAKLLVPDRLSVTLTVSDTYRLAQYPWLDRLERLTGVLEPGPLGSRPVPCDWRGIGMHAVGGVPQLEFGVPFEGGPGVLTLDVLRPADTLVNGLETAPGTGPTADTDTMPAGIEDLVVLGLVEVYQALASRSPGRPGGWDQKLADARERAERTYRFDGFFYAPRAPAAPAQGAAA